jgi:hypothetical protein
MIILHFKYRSKVARFCFVMLPRVETRGYNTVTPAGLNKDYAIKLSPSPLKVGGLWNRVLRRAKNSVNNI